MVAKQKVHPYRSIVRFLLIIVICMSVAGIAYYAHKAYKQWQSLMNSTTVMLQKKAYEQAQQLDALLATIAQKAEAVALELSTSGSDVQNIETVLKKLWDASPLIGATGVAYVHAIHQKPFSLFITKKVLNNRRQFVNYQIEKYYDYRQQKWYQNAVAGISAWSEPFIDVMSNLSVVRYAVPIARFDATSNTREVIGVLFIDLSHGDLANAMSKMTEAFRGYSFILSQNDELITYPIEEDVEEYKTLFNISRLPGKQHLRDVAKTVQTKRAGLTSYYDTLSQESFLVSFAPLTAAQWYVLIFSTKENIFFNPIIRHYLLTLLCMCLLFLCALYILVNDALGGSTWGWWLLSYGTAFGFMGITAFHLYMFYYSSFDMPDRTPIRSRVELARFEQFQNRLNQQLKKPSLIYIPTGLTINHMLMESANKVTVGGIIWQKYDVNEHKDLAQAIAIENAEEFTLMPLYKEKNGSIETIGWTFRAKLNVKFDKLQYPFDAQTIVMTLYHPSFAQNVVLVPDFLSYDSSEIGRFIGLNKDFHLEKEWILKDSYYYYRSLEKKTNFGLTNAVRKESFPDLNFAVVVSRQILDPFVAYVLPLIIISIILFYILLESSAVDLKISTTIGQISGLFLATVLAHQTFRRALDINIIVYLESFYFLMYFLTIVIASNCMIYVVQGKGNTLLGILRRRVMKFFYWPLLFFLVFLITLYFFR